MCLLDELLDELESDSSSTESDSVEECPPARLPTPDLGVVGTLPRKGDMYYYKNYQGEVVQGEVLSVVVTCEVLNPDGTYQSIPAQDLSLNKSQVTTSSPQLKRWVLDNSKLTAQYNTLLKRVERLRSLIEESED